ncbi:hypothetical protein C0416_03830 [bacterium]|nr:hypothetical protein [bacterium]
MLEYLALGIFGIAFIFIIIDYFDKSIIALLGALLMVIFRILTPDEALASIEFETIFLLMAMMILVNIASKSGIFEWVNMRIAALTRGNPLAIFLFFSLLTGIFSAFLDNVTTVILIVPLTIELVKGMGRDPKPYVISEIFLSNIGGALTLIGDPPNIIIGGATGFNFLDFVVNLWVPILFSAILVLATLVFKNWKAIKPISGNLTDLVIANIIIRKVKMKFVKKTIHSDFVIKVVLAILVTTVGFLLQSKIQLPNYVIAFTAVIVLGIVASKKVDFHEALRSVEWTTLLFFSGLFVMVAGIEQTGILEDLSLYIANSTSDIFTLSIIVLWISGIISMVLNNIPFITVMIPVIAGIQAQFGAVDTSILWWALSLGTCLGGNGTLIGASANVVSADLAKKEGVNITFMSYLKFSFPVTIGMLVVCSVYIYFVT